MRGERHEWMTVDIHTNLVTDFCNTIGTSLPYAIRQVLYRSGHFAFCRCRCWSDLANVCSRVNSGRQALSLCANGGRRKGHRPVKLAAEKPDCSTPVEPFSRAPRGRHLVQRTFISWTPRSFIAALFSTSAAYPSSPGDCVHMTARLRLSRRDLVKLGLGIAAEVAATPVLAQGRGPSIYGFGAYNAGSDDSELTEQHNPVLFWNDIGHVDLGGPGAGRVEVGQRRLRDAPAGWRVRADHWQYRTTWLCGATGVFSVGCCANTVPLGLSCGLGTRPMPWSCCTAC